ncbi:hypothetical protein P4O66_001708 [Electrophorus voltai]|uniref:Usher syndrome 2A (autosomal recessive, mild) n=1 Tax=Electrophorus voltai TaxID=2609070 RepID=A0AAD9DTU7_9TELE|nr:hypothetical protein P4O66_001708 [Electrophorus voltai]
MTASPPGLDVHLLGPDVVRVKAAGVSGEAVVEGRGQNEPRSASSAVLVLWPPGDGWAEHGTADLSLQSIRRTAKSQEQCRARCINKHRQQEIEEVYSGRLPRLYAQIECRCPPSHPRVHPLVERYCIPNGASDTTDDRVLRLNLDAHPLHYINDGDMGTAWVSSVLSTQEELDQGVTVTIDLQNGEYQVWHMPLPGTAILHTPCAQVFYVILQLRSAPAEAVQIQRKSSRTAEWSDWQYLASDCSILGMVSNGPLDRPDSVNCLRFPPGTASSRSHSHARNAGRPPPGPPTPNTDPGVDKSASASGWCQPSLDEAGQAAGLRSMEQGRACWRNVPYSRGNVTFSVLTPGEPILRPGYNDFYNSAALQDFVRATHVRIHLRGQYHTRNATVPLGHRYYAVDEITISGRSDAPSHGLPVLLLDPRRELQSAGFPFYMSEKARRRTCAALTGRRQIAYQGASSHLSLSPSLILFFCFSLIRFLSFIPRFPPLLSASSEASWKPWCDCHGHADACDTSVSPYRCACLPESHTQGAHGLGRPAPGLPCSTPPPRPVCGLIQSGGGEDGTAAKRYGGVVRAGLKASRAIPRPPQTRADLFLGKREIIRGVHMGRHSERESLRMPTTVDPASATGMHPPATMMPAWTPVLSTTSAEEGGFVTAVPIIRQIGGQCKCKPRVWGRRCDVCPHGFYGLQGALADGCRACGCHAAGTTKPDVTCHQDSGQCPCKANVMGLSCDRCNYGFKFLNHTNPDGCEPCGCHPDGSLHQFCDRVSGQCECRAGIRGPLCDVCGPGSYGPAPGGLCLPCDCSLAGSVAGSTCHPVTGECMCQLHVTGQRCDLCRAGYHSLGGDGELHCLPCVCNAWGVAEGSVCDRTTGYCHCKSGVEGPRCEQCSPHMYNLSSGNVTHACQPCLCDPSGTAVGTVCDPDSGQCVCQPTMHGPDCSTCKPGVVNVLPGIMGLVVSEPVALVASEKHCWHRHPQGVRKSGQPPATWAGGSSHHGRGNFRSKEGSCVACDCHPAGAAGPACAADTGQCTCSHASLTGRRCNRCRDLYFGFDPAVGRCDPCDCNLAGALNGSCLPETGQCVCKPFVTGEKCERCVEGASHMDPNNTLGCSKEPRQQPPPQGTALSARVIALSWRAPDSPNSDALTYTLLRDSEPIHASHSRHPFGLMLFTDEGLTPYTLYTYQLVTSNVHGNTTSSNVTLRTLVATPDPTELRLRLVGQAGPRAASFTWSRPWSPSAPVELYALISVDEESGQEHTRYEGLATAVTVDGLQPFTRYTFHLQACTSGGCARGDTVSVLTAQAPPQGQAPPRVTMLGPAQLRVDWEPPALPNGIIIRYELFMQILNKSLENVTNPNLDQRVFLSSGWLNPQKSGSASENSLTPPESSVVVSDLEPFTTYRFRVIAVNMAGSISSEWMIGRTAEGVPEYMGPPQVCPLSSFSLLVRWKTPQEQDVRGRVTEYRVSLYQEQSSNPYTPPTVTQVN